jgi:hypothetical protein
MLVKWYNKIRILTIAISALAFGTAEAGAQIDSTALDILDDAIGFIFDEGSGAIYYETVASNVADPMDIFSLPLYKVDKGGYWFFDGNRFEMNAAGMKALCDGKLISLVDENTHVMYLDSVRTGPMLEVEGEQPDLLQVIDKQFGDGNTKYLGEEEVKGRMCHKIEAHMEKMPDEYVWYWIDKKTSQLVLMAEHSDDAFTVYEIKKVGKVPKNHNYKIVMPDHELSEFYGYQVIDMRFANRFLATPGEE